MKIVARYFFVLAIIMKANICFASESPRKYPDTFKNKAIYYFKKWTYWDYLYKPKSVDDFIDSLKDKEPANKTQDKIINSPIEPNSSKKTLPKILQEQNKNLPIINLPESENKTDLTELEAPELPSEFNFDKSKDLPDISKNSGNTQTALYQDNTESIEEPLKLPKLKDDLDVGNSFAEEQIETKPELSEDKNIETVENSSSPINKSEESFDTNSLEQQPEVDNKIANNAENEEEHIIEIKDNKPSIEESEIATHDKKNETTATKKKDIVNEEINNISEASESPPENISSVEQIPQTNQENKDELTDLEKADRDIMISEGYNSTEVSELIKTRRLKTPEQIEEDRKDFQNLRQFIENELTMLVFPKDDVVLGKVTYGAFLSYTDDTTFLKEFWRSFYFKIDKMNNKVQNQYITSLEKNEQGLTLEESIHYSKEFIRRGDIDSLRVVLNNSDKNFINNIEDGYDLLENAIDHNNYDVAYFLLMRGMDVNHLYVGAESLVYNDNTVATPLRIRNLYKSAGAKSY
jgi:hypothetical protein